MKICIPIRENSMKAVLNKLKKAEKAALRPDLVEIWLDQVCDLDLKRLLKASKKPILAKGRPLFIKEAFRLGARLIDIDIKKASYVSKLLKISNRGKIIISYHNFQKTPSLSILLRIVKKAFDKGADIAKIATQVNRYSDNVILFELVRRVLEQKKDIICIGMGAKGRLSRIMCPILGSYLTYVALDEKHKTADGQLILADLRYFFIKCQ